MNFKKALILLFAFIGFSTSAFFLIKKVKNHIKFDNIISHENDLKTINIKIPKYEFERLKIKRAEALDLGILLASKSDYVGSQVQIGDKFVNSKIRLKGDWVDHLKHKNKWSFRIKVGEGKTYHGMRKFSLQHPKTRNNIYEWVFHKMQKDLGLISMRYDFVNVILEVDGKKTHLGIMALEEAFDKRLIENNERRSGLIVKYDETALWKDRSIADNNDSIERTPFNKMYLNSEIMPFNQSKIMIDSNLNMQFNKAQYLLDGYRKKELDFNEVFDGDKIDRYLAVINLLGSKHSLIWHNLRYYYNPVTSLLEPVGFDSNGGLKLEKIANNYTMKADLDIIPRRFLSVVVQDSFMNHFMNKHKDEMNYYIENLNTEFNDVSFDTSIINHNTTIISDYIKNNNLDESTIANKEKTVDFNAFKFIELDVSEKSIHFKSGNWKLEQTLRIPKGYKVFANSGFNLNIVNGAEIITQSPFFFEGNENKPIKIYSSNKTGDGIFFNACKQLSKFNYVAFNDLSNPKNESWSLTGAITFYKSDVEMENTLFSGNLCEDALNVFSSEFSLINCIFKNTYSDAFDGDFVNGEVKNCTFSDLGNDAIDVSGSKIYLENISINNALDKCISAGEKSEINGKNIFLKNSELGITSKDLSLVRLSDLGIDNCKIGFTAFQKKPEYDGAKIKVTNTEISNTTFEHLIEVNSELSLNGIIVANTDSVKERLYGNEFGKSSK